MVESCLFLIGRLNIMILVQQLDTQSLNRSSVAGLRCVSLRSYVLQGIFGQSICRFEDELSRPCKTKTILIAESFQCLCLSLKPSCLDLQLGTCR
jgi:hypothetical protein